ncbi:MAG: hypothetical protein AUK34_14295 [Ignavibacteria bacterium CG2_30_36_16]|nr:DUF4876 domain-containing protein [Ignavibacteria bacterium]OIP54908.1 MAG: hypothetical protein AUK34_14295 [Ignavibacteria bacterium CG2_30_36_16]
MNKFKIFITLLLLAIIFGCEEKPPTMFDGNATIHFLALYNISTDSLNPNYITLQNAKVILSSEYGLQVKQTDANGVFYMTGLPASNYNISVRMPHPEDSKILLTANLKDILISSGQAFFDTLYAKPNSSSGIAINEIYAGGPLNNLFFFYDQYIELYNSSDSVQYVDGFIVMRVSGNNEGKGSGADEDDDNDIDGVTYIFKFPGSPGEKNYPIQPGEFMVLASDAVNHKNSMSTSIDLSNANWEFYNQFSSTDIDNPNVPNLENLRSDRLVDFLINLTADVIVVASGVDTVWLDGIDISTIIDGVEYQSNPTSKQTLDDRVDRGFALSPPKYSGQSMQRREPGEDTNDSSLDWEIIPHPTPGYQK